MPDSPTFIAVKSPVRRKRKQFIASAAPAALTLVAASYGSFSLTLSFDRAIDVTAFDPSTLYVNDADRGERLQGGGDYSLTDPQTLVCSMGQIDDYGGNQTTLDAGADSGIVAVDDGGTWAGASGVVLPVG